MTDGKITPFTDDELHAIVDAAVANKDEQTARLARHLLWARDFCDQAECSLQSDAIQAALTPKL